MANRSLKHNEEVARQVEKLAALGVTQEDAANILGFSADTILRRYSKEWGKGKAVAKAKVAGKLFEKAMAGNLASICFYLKTQCGWRETQHVDHTSSDGTMASPLKLTVEYVDAQKREDEE